MYKKYNQLGDETKENIPLSYKIVEIQNHEHKQDLIRKNAILCIDVHANWCQPCKQMEPSYAVLAKRLSIPGKCMLVKENIETGLSREFGITAVPVFLIFYKGALHKRITGADLEPVDAAIQELLNDFSNQYTESPHPPVDPGYGRPPTGHVRERTQQPQQPRSQPQLESEGMQPYQGQPTTNYKQNYGSQCHYDPGPDKTSSPAFNPGNRSVRQFNNKHTI